MKKIKGTYDRAHIVITLDMVAREDYSMETWFGLRTEL